MSLLATENKTVTATTAAFEADEDGVIATPATVTAPATGTAPAASTPIPTAQVLTVPTGGALASPIGMVNPFDALKNALRVDFNTLEQVIPNQGSFMCRESKKILGDTITFEVLSHQDAWVVSPEDDKAPNEVVKYSDDAQTCSDGTAVQEHLVWLRTNGYPKAKLKQRVVVVVALMTTAKSKDMEGTLVQLDLSPANKTQWSRYVINSAFGVKIGKFTVEQSKIVKAECEIATSGTNTYTLAKFSVAS